MPYAGLAVAQTHKSKSSSTVEGVAGKNDNDDNPFWDRDPASASSTTGARTRGHLNHGEGRRPSCNDIIDLTLDDDDDEKCARPREPDAINLTFASPIPSRLLVQRVVDETETERSLDVARYSEDDEDDDVIFVETAPPTLVPKAKVRSDRARMQTQRLPYPQQGVLELRDARSPIRIAEIVANQALDDDHDDGEVDEEDPFLD